MSPMIVFKTANGYAVVPFTGEVPAVNLAEVSFAAEITSYSYGKETVARLLESHFEPPQQLKEAA